MLRNIDHRILPKIVVYFCPGKHPAFYCVRATYNCEYMKEKNETEAAAIKKIFTRKKIIDFIINEFLGKFVGFLVGMSTASWFSYEVYEKKGLRNLFGLAKRKKVIVNTTPEWIQWLVSAIVGFIVLELIRYFFETKMYLKIWNYAKARYKQYKGESEEPEVLDQLTDSRAPMSN